LKIKHALNIFFWVVFIIISCNDPETEKYQKMLQSHPTIISQITPSFYLNLFQPKVKSKIKLIKSLEHIGRDTVSNFLYNQEYYVAIYTLARSYEFSLQKSLQESFNESEVEFRTSFYVNEINFIGIRHRISDEVNSNNKPSDILTSFGGSGFSKRTKNDSIADYFFECENLSIKYGANSHQEVFVDANGKKPLEIMFLKKEGKLFLIFITSKKDSASFNPTIGSLLFE